jgi:pimeloyl-ACP methyl ester carboxylesterase
MGGTGRLWRPVAAGLESTFNVLALDQRGHGASQSPTPLSYHPVDYGSDVIETLEEDGFYPSFFVGHSMGVRTAVAAAHLRPEYCRGLILVDLSFQGMAGGGFGAAFEAFLKRIEPLYASREEARARLSVDCPDPSILQYLMAVAEIAHDGTLRFPFEPAALLETIQSVKDFSVRPWVEDFARTGKPVLVLRGAISRVWTHQEFEQEAQRLSPYRNVVFEEFEGAGHGLPFEKRSEFVDRVRRFCSPQKLAALSE